MPYLSRDLNCALLEQGGVLIVPDLGMEGSQLCIILAVSVVNCSLLEH